MAPTIIFDDATLDHMVREATSPTTTTDQFSSFDDLSLGSMGKDFQDGDEQNGAIAVAPGKVSPTKSPLKPGKGSLSALASRMVSLPSMTGVAEGSQKSQQAMNERPSPNATFDLQDRVPSPSLKRDASFSTSSSSGTVASVFNKTNRSPSLLAHFLQQKSQEEAALVAPPPQKKTKHTIHVMSSPFETIQYDQFLNFMIQKGVDSKLLERVINADPNVLLQQDNAGRTFPLHILLKHKPNDVSTADAMMLERPEITSFLDNKGNTPLHIAIMSAVSIDTLEIVHHLCAIYPQALRLRNYLGRTPLQLAQQRSTCPEEIASYLLEKEHSQY